MARTSLNLEPRVHLRLISSTCVSSDPTQNIWWWDIDRGAPGRGKRWDSSCWTHGDVYLRREVLDGHAIPVRNTAIYGRRKRRSWAPSLRTRRAAHDNRRLWVLSRPQELGDHVSIGRQATSYDKSDRWSSVTTDRDSINDHPIIRVSPQWDPTNEAQRISMIGRTNRAAVNSSTKYLLISRSMTIKCGSSASGRTPPQPGLQHGPTTGLSLWDKSWLSL
jgi:hypothetical protein